MTLGPRRSLFIGTVGAPKCLKAVCIDKRKRTCACVGRDSNGPLDLSQCAVWMLLMPDGVRIWTLNRKVETSDDAAF